MKEKFLHYTIEELASEESFIHWVNRTSHSDHIRWEEWKIQHPEMEEKIDSAKQIVNSLVFQEKHQIESSESLLEKINTTITNESRALRRKIRIYYLSAAAACLAIVLVFAIGLSGNEVIETEYGQSITHHLPDNTMIQLNAGSEIRYKPDKWETNRHLRLMGEAYFDVITGSRFVVETKHGKVEVIGTQFNVFSRPSGFRVQCLEGQVRVLQNKQSQAIDLVAGERVELSEEGEIIKYAIQQNSGIPWLKNTYYFNDQPLEDVFDELERQFAVHIKAEKPSILQLRYTGFFDTQDLEKALYAICWPMHLESKTSGNTVIISENSIK